MCTCPTSATSGKPLAMFVLASQLLAAVTVSMVPERPGLFCEPEEMVRKANIPPSTCWPSNWGTPAPDRPSVSAAEADDCSAPPVFWFGSDKHRLSPAAWSPDHNSLNTGDGRGEKGDGCWVENERNAGHISKVLLKIIALSLY